MNSFTSLDFTVFAIYAVVIIGLGLWVSRTAKGTRKTSQEYFLANRSLPWWAIGASLIAANISAEHFIAISGSGFRIGLGIAAYEWIAAITLIIVAKFFLPIFLDKKITTMPQFIEQRYNRGVSLAFAILWLMVYVFVNLTSVSWLGALAMNQIMNIPTAWGVIGLLLFSGVYSIYGGLKSVAWTDVIQVVFLVGGGLVTAFLAINAAGHGSIIQGCISIYEKALSPHFSMIIPKDTIVSDGSGGLKDAFQDLPGLAVIFGAMWLTNLGYWGFNQYIIQKGLAAKNLIEARRGLIFAAYLKILIPVLVIVPGITAYVLFNHPELREGLELHGTITKADQAYPWLLKNFIPSGIRGLAFAALVAAVVSSLASMINSTATIFTMDIYKTYFKPDAADRQLVKVGRIVALSALIIAMATAKRLLGGLDQAFQYIQEYTGYIYPGVVVVFGMGLIWKQSTSRAALWTAIATLPAGIAIKIAYPEMPFILRMGYVCIVLISIALAITLLDKHKVPGPSQEPAKVKSVARTSILFFILAGVCFVLGIVLGKQLQHLGFESIFMLGMLFAFIGIILYTNVNSKMADRKAIYTSPGLFSTIPGFNIAAIGIVFIITALYFFFW